VVSRDYSRTRAWARRLYHTGSWAGVRRWSYYDPVWASFGVWDCRWITVEDVAPIQLDNPALIEASRTIVRRILRMPRR
jgi:hypothetical protein